MEAEVRHHRDDDEVDAEARARGSPGSGLRRALATLVHREHAIAVSIEGTPVEARATVVVGRQVGRAAADVDVRSVRLDPDGVHLDASCSNTRGANVANAPLAQSTPIRSPVESAPKRLDDVCEVTLSSPSTLSIDPPPGPEASSSASIASSSSSRLPAVAVEELDAVVLGRVVGGRDDGSELLGEKRDRRGRQHAGEDGGAAGRGDALGKCFLERGARTASVSPDEDAAPS